MTDVRHQKDMEERLWKELGKVQQGMLGLSGEHRHFQPMTPFAEADAGQIWFFTRDDTDLARSVGEAAHAMFVIQSKDQHVQACIGGRLIRDHDEARIDRYWNPVVAAWYPNGKADPHLTMLRLDCDDAQMWLSEGGPVKFAWEIARANITKTTPDVGDSVSLDLR